MKKKVLAIVLTSALVLSLGLVLVGPVGANSNESPCDEVLILSDAGSRNDGGISTLYWVCLDDVEDKAVLTPLPAYSGSSLGDGEIPLDVVAAIAASPDGTKIYAIDNDSSELGIYDLSTSPPTWTLLPQPVRNSVDFTIKQIALAACDPDTGTLYVVSNFHNRLFTVDTTTAITTPIDFITGAGDTAKNDIAFDLAGMLYLYNNLETQHLYTMDPATAIATPTTAAGPSNGLTGLALRNNGAGPHLVGSDYITDQIVVFSPDDGSDVAYYDTYLNTGARHDFWYGDMTIGPFGIQEISVFVDIKPTSCPNPLNLKSKGVLPVAILGTEGFDVTEIDPATVALFWVGSDPFDPIIPPDEISTPLRTALEDVAAPYDGELVDCLSCWEEGPDGFQDLTLKFSTQAIVEVIGDEVEDGDCISLILAGNLFDGTAFSGSDIVRIIKKGR